MLAFLSLVSATLGNRMLHMTTDSEKFVFSELGNPNCPEGYEKIYTREICRCATQMVKMYGMEECGLENVECKDKKNWSREKKRFACMGLDMTVPKPKIYVGKEQKFNSNSRYICQKNYVPECECDSFRFGASETDEELCMKEKSSSTICEPIRTNPNKPKCAREKTLCKNVPTTTQPICEDNNALVGLMLTQMEPQIGTSKFPGVTSNCEFLLGVTDASSTMGTGCFLFGEHCCATCAGISSGDSSLGYMTEYRYWLYIIYMSEVFTIEKSEYADYVANQRYFAEDSVVTVPVAGVYTGPLNIIEYFLLQNPNYSNGRHYIILGSSPEIELVELSETYIEFTYYSTFPNYYINNEPFSNLYAEFKLYFTDRLDPIVDHLIVDFLDSDVQAMVDSFGSNAELCSQIQSTCTGRNAQFSDEAACNAYLSELPLIQDGCPKLKGPTQSCRWTHLTLAQPDLRPELHCYHVGPEVADPTGAVKCSIADCDSSN